MKSKSIYFVLISALLTGCGGEEFQDLKDFVKNSGADMRGKIPPPPEVKPYEPFYYNNDANLPDPFKPRKPNLKNAKAGANQPDYNRPKQALEEFALENLKMVGYIYKGKVAYAVIRSPDGKLHNQIKAGNYIGTNFGLVTEIKDTEVIVKEQVQDSAGDWTERISSLQLIE